MSKKRTYEKTNRTSKKRRNRSARSLQKAPSQEEIVSNRYQKGRSVHPAKQYAEKVKTGKTSLYPFIKYQDVGSVPAGGRLVEEWQYTEIIPAFPHLRKGKTKLPKSFHFWDHQFLMKHFGLRAWEFGNWLTNEDRMNYVCGSGIALYDMRAVLQFPNREMGLEGMVSLAIGARGKSVALAHFEPHTFAINLTRYESNPTDKQIRLSGGLLKKHPKLARFLHTGGVGSLAHEYGHALDYFFGGYVDQDPSSFSLSGGHSVRTRPDNALMKKKTIRGLMEKVLFEIIWQNEDRQSSYYARLINEIKERKIKSDYYYRRNELFARFFEQYIRYKLKQKGVENHLLHKHKYLRFTYLPENHLKRIVPTMDKLIGHMRAYLKKV